LHEIFASVFIFFIYRYVFPKEPLVFLNTDLSKQSCSICKICSTASFDLNTSLLFPSVFLV